MACTLAPEDGVTRMRRWRVLVDTTNAVPTRDGATLEVRFEPGDGVREELDALVASEQQCCSFVRWAVSDENGIPVLRIVADTRSPDDIASIADLFAAS